MSNLMTHAENEMRIAGLYDADSDYGGMIPDAVLKMMKVFADEGHSGMSASLVISIFQKIARYEPLTPLTGADDEWHEPSPGTFQNVRCSHVFKDGKDGQAYDINGKVFRYPNGACYTGRDSRVFIDFPYTPTREFVDVPDDDETAP
ncbi:hypothetical protein UFOVP1204_67 [uncultured Caudovirales phage]|uniref:Uncharacterized protein n=1 Tax=uncultured Caudovirales phage TaxID=2100421 RepID=A0A6J5ML46_9CAUD|nr:hypothetical protein UFOVP473_34 [uncultured Caudovirales phage]CAB4176544.1 hypothetical protein UFOVP983_34 [uncultured Caudovirales phage]CAB4190396.1 hypothetical protein UFOVP1204_67 [uncultured Caudovirales phage]